MAKFAGALAQLNVGKGDRVVIYMPMVPQVLSIMHSIMVHHVPLISASMRVKFNLFTQYHGSWGGKGGGGRGLSSQNGGGACQKPQRGNNPERPQF